MLRKLLFNAFWLLLANFATAQTKSDFQQEPLPVETSLISNIETAETAARLACSLPAPTGLHATKITPTSIRIEWNPVQGAVGYRIVVIEVGSGQTVGTHNVTTNFFTKTGLQPGKLYLFQVRSRCPNPPGGYSEPVAMLTERTAYIIVDVIIQRCCPEAADSTVQAANSTTNYAMTLGAGDYWHIRAEKFGSETTFIDFCITDSCPEFRFLEYAKMNVPSVTSTGSQVTATYQKTATVVADWFYVKNLACDPTAVNATFSITWKIKTEVFAEYCPAWAPPATGLDDRSNSSVSFENPAGWEVLPNPFSDVLRVSLPDNDGLPADAFLFDSQGKLVRSIRTVGSSFELSTGDLPLGLYFLQVRAGGFSETVRVVKVE